VVFTVILHGLLASMTVPATPRAVNRYRITFLEAVHTFSKFCNPTSIFMTQRELSRETKVLFHQV